MLPKINPVRIIPPSARNECVLTVPFSCICFHPFTGDYRLYGWVAIILGALVALVGTCNPKGVAKGCEQDSIKKQITEKVGSSAKGAVCAIM